MQSFWGDCMVMQEIAWPGGSKVNEEALKRVLVRLKTQGWAVATQDLPSEPGLRLDQEPPPTEPVPPLSADEVAALPLDVFGGRSLVVKVWSSILDGNVWFVSGEAQVRVLQGRGVHRADIYIAQELTDLLDLFERDAEKAQLVLDAKRLFGGSLHLEKGP